MASVSFDVKSKWTNTWKNEKEVYWEILDCREMSIKALKWTIIERLETDVHILTCNDKDEGVHLATARNYMLESFIEWTLNSSCGSKDKSSSTSIILGILNKVWSKCTVRFHHDSVPGILFLLPSRSPAGPLQQCSLISYTLKVGSLQSLESRKAFSGQHCQVDICRLYCV